MRNLFLLILFLLPQSISAQISNTNKTSSNTDESQVAYSVFNLPLIVINTFGEDIPKDDPRIRANMKIINNGEGELNRMFDDPNEYDGFISIERRGESSSGFAKKSFSLELQNADSSNNNVSILGLPEENDFVLYAPYSDKTFMRNVIVYSLYLEMGNWAPRTKFVEVVLNNDYRGIYVFMEKIKRDENRVDIDKIEPADITDPEITGGYIMRRDKTTGMEPFEYWKSPVDQIYYEPLTYQYFDPDYYELNDPQRAYIRNYMQEFDEMMSGPDFDDPETGYRAYIDVESFIDMLIINEFSKGLDAYMFSTYFFKQNDADGGKLFAGPPWDYNISLFNVNYGYDHDIPYVYNWVYDNWSRVYWWSRLMEDEDFEWEVLCRWEELRHGILKDESIDEFIDGTVDHLGDAVVRNFEKFPILGTYIWPNKEWPNTYSGEIKNLKSWIEGRLNWVDGEWGDVCEYTGKEDEKIEELASGLEVRIRPNPSDLSHTYIDIKSESQFASLDIEVFDINGRLVFKSTNPNPDSNFNVYKLPDLTYLTDGMYLVRILNGTELIYSEKLIKHINSSF
ncbi:MAG: CotH kinase family protein [Bacteroidales bacterium]|jgi:hypothetical protein|nr:CotH kinase family protein [Bacteroidales bacterium]